MLPPDFPEDFFAEDFDPVTYQRGLDYARQGRAEILEVLTFGDGALEVHGECRGSGRKRYQLTVWIEALEEEGLPYVSDSECSCPVGIDCKHAAALALTFASRLQQLPPPDAAPEAGLPTQPTVSKEVERWLDLLDAEPDGAPSPGTPVEMRRPCLLYQLHLGSPPRLSVGKSQPLKRGGMSKPSSFKPQSYDLSPRTRREYVSDADNTPLSLMLASQFAAGASYIYLSGSDAVDVHGETGALLLASVARSGRLYVAGQLDQPLQLEAGRPLQLKWRHDKSGRQQLSFDLPPQVHVLPVWPPYFFDPDTRSVGCLVSELPEATLRALLVAPALSEHEALLVRDRLAGHTQRKGRKLPLPEAGSVTADAGPPQARLRLCMGRFRHEAMFSINEDYPVAELLFDYPEGITVAGSEHPHPVMQIQDGDAPRLLRRDLARERAVWQTVESVGLVSQQRRLPQYLRLDSPHEGLLAAPADLRGWMPLLGEGLPRLQADGVEIEYADNFPFRLAEAEEWFVDIEEADEGGQDWFDLDLGVVIDGARVSLVPPLLQLLKEQPRLLAQIDEMGEDTRLPLRLDGRRVLPVPVPRLRSWLRPLLEFLDGDRPRLSRHQAAMLADLDGQPTRWLGGEALRELGQRLRNFSGIETAPPAAGFTATLRPYQQVGLNWLQFLRAHGLGGVLADDMGLGKTVQTLAHLHLEKTSGRADRPSLVIAPTSLLPNWAAEARQFAPELKVLVLHGPERDRHFDTLGEFDLVLTTYPLLVRDRAVLLAQPFHVLVLDEAQFIKNPKAQSHQVARRLDARHRLSLTGTPLENHLGELWAQFDFLMPGLVGDAQRFNRLFRTPIEKQGDTEAQRRLSARVAPFLLRRTKDQVLADLPPCTEIVRWVELGGAQRDLYESLRVAFDRKLREVLKAQGVGRSQIMILDALLKLRQACCDPRLVKMASARGIHESAKLDELMTLLEELLDEGRRVLLFSQFTTMLGLIETELKSRGIGYAKLTGQTRDRATPIEDFQSGKVPLFMISLKAGGTGLNLTAADTVIHYDPWWNPAVEAQATARAHRIGQDKPVFVYKLLGRGTVEEKILALQGRKRGLADRLLSGTAKDDSGHLITADDLDVLFEPLN